MTKKQLSLDDTTAEVLWCRLRAIVEVMATVTQRTAFSTLVRESIDYSCVICDAVGKSLVQSEKSATLFSATSPRTIQAFLKKYPPAEWEEGDVVATNDAWIGTGHINDITIAVPIFFEGNLVGFIGIAAHLSDIGGRVLSAEAESVFEEGLQLPIIRFARKWSIDPIAEAIIRANVRIPDLVMGDIKAIFSAAHVGIEQVREMMLEFGYNDLGTLAQWIYNHSSQAFLAALSQIPRSSMDMESEVWTDGYQTPLVIRARVVVKEDRISVDYEGTSPQVKYGINCTLTYTDSYTGYCLKCLLAPDVPNNEGIFKHIEVTAPLGSILNPRFPAPVAARNMTGHYIPSAVFKALSNVLPDQIIADCGAPRPIVTLNGEWPNGKRFVNSFFLMGGYGAGNHKDGHHCLAFPSNCQATPVEVMEHSVPVLVLEKKLKTDSGGKGTFRGGCGQRVRFKILDVNSLTMTITAGRTKFPPLGLNGGGPGALARIKVNHQVFEGYERVFKLVAGDEVEIETPGGGGVGDPRFRDQRLLAYDIAEGLFSKEYWMES